MLNFRKLKQDFSSSIVKEGKALFDDEKVVSAKILHLDHKTIRIAGRVVGQFDNAYESEIEIDRHECEAIDSDCDCPYNYDCHHLAALLFYLEKHIDQILVSYSNDNDLEQIADEHDMNKEIIEKVKEAQIKADQKQEQLFQEQLLQEYVASSNLLATSPFFRGPEKRVVDQAEVALIFSVEPSKGAKGEVEVQLALRLPFRSKPLYVPNIREFVQALRYEEPIFMGGRRYCFSLDSFDPMVQDVMSIIRDQSIFAGQTTTEKAQRIAFLSREVFGRILADLHDKAVKKWGGASFSDDELPPLPGVYLNGFDAPLRFALQPAQLRFNLEYMKPPISKILMEPQIAIDERVIELEDTLFLECAQPGMIFESVYYRFPEFITRQHLSHLKEMRDLTIPEPLFGTFVENALPEFAKHALVCNQRAIEHFVTMPFVGVVQASCELSYLDGELDAKLFFHYDKHKIPASAIDLAYDDVSSFVTEQGILARNLVEERKIIEDIFSDFLFNEEMGVYVAKSDKKIIEFMTDVIPRNKYRVNFNCPQNLLDRFIYDKSSFEVKLLHTDKVDHYHLELKVDGALEGVKMDLLWECMATKRSFIELSTAKGKGKRKSGVPPKILVLDLDRISGVIQLFDELRIEMLETSTIECPLWSLATIDESLFKDLPVKFSMTKQLKEIRSQMLGEKELVFSPVPKVVKATLRHYQEDGVQWLERIRGMYLSGVLADDMGLGKTLQAIVALAQCKQKKREVSIIICPTSLLYNWKEEFAKFHPGAKVMVVDGIPTYRKKLIETVSDYDVIVTSYTLLQKDIEQYKEIPFCYAILDEAQHIKNRSTRNAKSTKMIQAKHRLILTGTPIENSLDELWSLFDFLMPGFLSSYDRFLEKYIRVTGFEQAKNLEYLKKKVSPFILRRMKADVLDDLPPVSENIYHCQLSDAQRELYKSYAESARDELVKLVERDGFDRVQIHVLATLTRLKQICCHPAIFAKEKPEVGDSAKYDMLFELLSTLIEGGHKTVIFSQYTRMLQIMSEDLRQKGISYCYLDGTTKNRLEVVKQFNDDATIPVFLVSLKAGGTGLNLVGADTVIHYDMWWNPAVESQATDRVHRLGQKNNVSSYKLITLGTIEEKIAEMQSRKKGLVKKIVSCDDEAIAKLTWEDVLELLKT